MSYRTKVLIVDLPQYAVTSYGNGGCYVIVRKADNASLCVQGDAADEFRTDVLDQDVFPFETALQHYDYDMLLAVNKNG